MPELAPEPLIPPLVLAAGLVTIAGAGALANCAVLAALLKRSRKGVFSIIIQLAVADLLLGASIAPEMWSLNTRTWYFGSSGCIAYQGLSVFISTASVYLVVAIALHTLATINLEKKAAERRIKRSGRDEDEEEIKSSRHSLVANSDSSTPPRTMNVDYRLIDTRVPATLPTIFIWILSASLSVPEFALASIVHLEKRTMVCTLDANHRFNVKSILAVFNLFLPLFIMSTVSVLIIFKLGSKKRLHELDNRESVAALKLSLWLMIVYGVLCIPRSVISAYNVYSDSMTDESPVQVQISYRNVANTVISLALSGVYLLATLVRPLLYIIWLPQIRKVFAFNSTKDTDDV